MTAEVGGNVPRIMPVAFVKFDHERKVKTIQVRGAWFPKRDDVHGVIAFRAHLLRQCPSMSQYRPSADEMIEIDIYVNTPDIDLDRAVAGCCTAMDGQHGQVEALLWDDSVVRQIRVTRLGPDQDHAGPIEASGDSPNTEEDR